MDAREFRAEIVDLYARNGNSEFEKLFDWYYRDVGQNAPASWILTSGTEPEIYGLCTVTTRLFRLGNTILRAGVLGNFLVDKESRPYLGAVSLVRAAKSLVNNRELDILVGLPNRLAEPLLLRMGFHAVGAMRTMAQVFRSRDAMRHRFGALGTLASPVLDAVSTFRRRLSSWSRMDSSRFRIVELSENQLCALATENWFPPAEQTILAPSGEFLRSRFLRHPIKRYRAFGILDTPGDKVVAVLSASVSAGRLHICDCSTDSREISDAEAILAFCDGQPARSSTVWITTLQQSRTFQALARCGSYRIPASYGGWPDTPLVGYWKPDHPLSTQFGSPSCWNLYVGFNDV